MKKFILVLCAGMLLHSCVPDVIPTLCIDWRDSRAYIAVTIGSQVWMAENLAYLPSVSKSTDGSRTEPHYYVYGYEGTDVEEAQRTENYKKYGVLYNWSAVMQEKGICPKGWHLPSDDEWNQLVNYLADNGYNFDGTTGGAGAKVAKALSGTYGWDESSKEGAVGNDDYPAYRNKSRFSALPGGFCSPNTPFKNLGNTGYWWSTTEKDSEFTFIRRILYNSEQVVQSSGNKICGFSVRCVRD